MNAVPTRLTSATYNLIQFSQPAYLRRLIDFRSSCNTRSSSVLTLQLHPPGSNLKITNRSSRLDAPRIWNSVPLELRSFSSDNAYFDSSSSVSPLALSKSFSFPN